MTLHICVLVRGCGLMLSAPLRRCESLRALRIPLLLGVSMSAFAQVGAPNPPQVPDAGSLVVGGLYMYPQHGQSQKQQEVDRYECYSWARGQTGYDPSAPTSGLSPSQQSSRLSDYRRAMSACLDARGYAVSAPPAYSPPPPAPAAAPPPVIPAARRAELNYHPFEFQIDGGYTVTAGTTNQDYDGGSNVGVGFTWFPTSALPLGIRVDGSYSTFDATSRLLSSTNYTEGREHIYGGDADVQLDLAHRSSRQKLYLLGGVGRYREQTHLKQVMWENGIVCGWWYCAPGYFPAVTAELNTTSGWERSWNAGIGWEIAVGPRASFFIEGRYQRILPNNSHQEFVPIRVGLRF
jgi:hypothetical protein